MRDLLGGDMELILVIFLVWLVSAAICSNLAKQKGHDSTLWGFLGFFLGPIAILFIAVAAPQGETASKGPQTGTKQCYACAEFVRLEANVCRYCGAEFDTAETAQLIANSQAGEVHSVEEEAEYKKMLFRNGCVVILLGFGVIWLLVVSSG